MTGSFSASVCSGDGVMLRHLCLALPCGYDEGVGALYIHINRYSVYVYVYVVYIHTHIKNTIYIVMYSDV